MMEDYYAEQYSKDKEQIWDEFIVEQSVNGTFLQTRRFLNYHPSTRFEDCSYMIYNKRKYLAAVCPACRIVENGEIVFCSHKGSTYGGIIFASKTYHVEQVLDIVDCLEEKIKKDGFQKGVFKITPTLFSVIPNDLLQYAFYYKKYKIYNELNLMIDYSEYGENILSNFSQGKRTNVHNCEKRGCILKELQKEEQIAEGYQILCKTLEKHNITPVHTIDELLDLKYHTIPEEIGFFGVYLEDKMIAFSTMFYFYNVKVAHSQYVGALSEYNALSPATYMYYCMIKEMRTRGFEKISWGISTEHLGLKINMGLTKSKEAYGSICCLNQIYEKNYESD